MRKIKIGIVGYGNLGKGVEQAIEQNKDMELVGVFTRRNPKEVNSACGRVYKVDEMQKFSKDIDVAILCGGSATDLPNQGVEILKNFNTVDSYDTHAKIPEYFASMDTVGKSSKKLAAISIGWDPGMFSIMRCLFESYLPSGDTYTFWGRGVSQGHSDAIRRVDGVKAGIQYTVPIENAIDAVRSGINPKLLTKDKHLRQCYVVLEDGANKAEVENAIKNMPNYFSDYETTVEFISQQELMKNHSAMPHGGFVLRSGKSHGGNNMLLELSIKLQSNPEFTSSVLVSYARAVYKMHCEGKCGAMTVYDVPIKYLIDKPYDEIVKNLL